MRIFFSGIGGVGIGPLAQIAQGAGYEIAGSDLTHSLTTVQLERDGVKLAIGEQTGDFLRHEHTVVPFDYFVYTAALPRDHPELAAAHDLGIMCLKRDGLIARIISEHHLQMLAVAGTHGKTTTSGLLVWVMKELNLPVSYSVGTTLTYGLSGEYDSNSRYFVYECDEYDRNMLHFTPAMSLLTSLDYDHPDTYPTLQDYQSAFVAFIEQSDRALLWKKDYIALGTPHIDTDYQVFDDQATSLDHLRLPGIHLRQNAFLVERAIMRLFPDIPYHDLVAAINSFPGTDRRMELLADNLYTDYGHHPAEIAATLQMARELSERVVLVYQPHQNLRQHQIKDEYTASIFANANEVYWLPTYLSRENPDLPVLSPHDLGTQIPSEKLRISDMNDELWRQITAHRDAGHLVVCMGAGSIDAWLRERLERS